MKIMWVSYCMFERGPGQLGLTSQLASARYRILLPVTELNRLGHEITLGVVGDPASAERLTHNLAGDLIVFSKSGITPLMPLAAAARAKGMKLIFDVCDDHFEQDELGPNYRAMAQISDAITCTTPALEEIVQKYTKAPCHIIDDPYEGERGVPSFQPTTPLKVMWFGSLGNIDSLQAAVPSLSEAHMKFPLQLTVVTSPPQFPEQHAITGSLMDACEGKIPLRLIPWSLENQYHAMHECDLVIIPSLENDSKRVKSPNRIVEPLWHGRMVVANPVPSYTDFAHWAWVGKDLKEGIIWVMEHRSEIPARILQAQEYIAQRFAPNTIGERWEHVLSSVIAGKRAAQA